MKESKVEIKKIKLSEINQRNHHYDMKFYYFFHSKRMKKLEDSIREFGYSPKKFNSWITVGRWNKQLLGLQYRPFSGYTIRDGNHRISVLNKLYPPETEIEVKVINALGFNLILIMCIVAILSLVCLWVVFTNWWIFLLFFILSLGINYTKAKNNKDFFNLIFDNIKKIKNKLLKK